MTITTSPAAADAAETPDLGRTGYIDKDIQGRIALSITQMNQDLKERAALIHDMWATRVAQLHLLMLGPGGSGKSQAVRRMTNHISDSTYFETALDETSDPAQVFGPPDIKGMVDEGKNRRVVTGMFPEATDGFLDEFFNANGPLLHSVMPCLNERLFSNGDPEPMKIRLRTCFMGTNKLNADADQAALWDRVHIRHIVEYVKDRQNQIDMVGEAIARMALVGRGTSTLIPGQKIATLTVAELDQAHNEAMRLNVPDPVMSTLMDIKDELEHGPAGIVVSSRRLVEGMAAILGNAYVRGHETVQVADLDILANMWWTLQEQRSAARSVILEATNPGEKAALDLLEELDKIKAAVNEVGDKDKTVLRRVAVEQVTNVDRLLAEANQHLDNARDAGLATTRIEEVIARSEGYKAEVADTVFGIKQGSQAAMANV